MVVADGHTQSDFRFPGRSAIVEVGELERSNEIIAGLLDIEPCRLASPIGPWLTTKIQESENITDLLTWEAMRARQFVGTSTSRIVKASALD